MDISKTPHFEIYDKRDQERPAVPRATSKYSDRNVVLADILLLVLSTEDSIK